ncbi:MAG: carboxypeptidase regulatory-like domain-containing protein [Bryobacteraceae bacterium]
MCLLMAGASGQAQDNRRLMGTVSDATSAPLQGVSVLLNSLDRVFQTRSNAAGIFRFEDVPSGFYELELSAPGFVKQTLPVDLINGSQSLAIVLKVGSMPDMNYCGPHPAIAYRPPSAAGPRLDGVIQDYYSRKPISKAEIAVWRAGQQVSMRRSDKAGKFAFTDLPAGYYDLRISRPGYWTEDVKRMLLPRENGVAVNVPILKRSRIVVCQ